MSKKCKIYLVSGNSITLPSDGVPVFEQIKQQMESSSGIMFYDNMIINIRNIELIEEINK